MSGRHQELWGSQGTREVGRRQTGGALGTPVKSLDFIAEECHIQNCLETCPLAATAQSSTGGGVPGRQLLQWSATRLMGMGGWGTGWFQKHSRQS